MPAPLLNKAHRNHNSSIWIHHLQSHILVKVNSKGWKRHISTWTCTYTKSYVNPFVQQWINWTESSLSNVYKHNWAHHLVRFAVNLTVSGSEQSEHSKQQHDQFAQIASLPPHSGPAVSPPCSSTSHKYFLPPETPFCSKFCFAQLQIWFLELRHLLKIKGAEGDRYEMLSIYK